MTRVFALRVELDDILINHIKEIGEVKSGYEEKYGNIQSCGVYNSSGEMVCDTMGSIYSAILIASLWNGINKELNEDTIIMKIE